MRDLDARLATMEEVLSQAACGNLDVAFNFDEGLESIDALTAVETGINILIADMGSEVQESKRRADELEEKLSLIEKQRKATEELSTPIIKIWDRVPVLPLIGTLDTRRSLS